MVDHNRQFEPLEDPDFENDLRQALRPRSTPLDFTARVLRQIPPDAQSDAAPATRRASIFHFPTPARLAAVASLLIVILAGTFAWQHHQRRVEGERARRQVLLALQITHTTLQQVADNISSIQNRKELQP